MDRLKFWLLSVLVASIFLPNVSEAYFTTAQSAVRLTDETLMYTVTYRFGSNNFGMKLPVGAVRNEQFNSESKYLGFTLFEDSDTQSDLGHASAIVLSDAIINDGEYYIPQGKSATFTLFVFLKLTEEEQSDNLNLTLQVTSLPFTIIDEDSVLTNRLNPSELQYYVTPEID